MKIFPVYENKACLLKWTWHSLFLFDGKVSSCHRSGPLPIELDNFDNFPNYEARLKERKLMLENIWPGHGCEYCANIEKAGGTSDRLHQLKLVEKDRNLQYVPVEVLNNPEEVIVQPKQIEVYLSNACNMSCLYCGPALSSRWVQENKKFGIFDPRIERYQREYRTRVELFLKWLQNNWLNINYLNILGGEPFYQPEFQECIDIIKKLQPNPNLKLGIFTNLKISLPKLKRITGELYDLVNLGKFKNLVLTISLDCWGEEQEYVRAGSKLANIERNLDYLVTLDPWLELNINSTMNCLSIKTMPQLLEKMCDYNRSRQSKIVHSFNLLVNPKNMKPHNFPSGFFDDDFEKILDIMVNNINYSNKDNIDHMKGCIASVNAIEFNPDMISDLKKYLDNMDIRHSTNWKETFPWLKEF